MATVSVDLIHRADDDDRSRRDSRRIVGTLLFAGTIAALLMAKPEPIELAAEPRALNFGQQEIGKSATQTVSFSNASKQDFVAEGLTLDGSSADFAVASRCGRLAGGESCRAEVTFTPRAEGLQSTTISLAGTSAHVIVTGIGVPAPVQPNDPAIVHLLSPSVKSLDFVNIDGNFQGNQSVTFTNEGNDNVIVMPNITGDNFTIADDECSRKQTLPPRDQCVITIASSATAAARSGTLSIIGADDRIEASVALTGAAAISVPPPSPRLRTDRTSVDFNSQEPTPEDANQISRYLELSRCDNCPRAFFHIDNDGPGPLIVESVTVDQNAESFGVADGCSNTQLAELSQCLVVVMWRPNTAGGAGRVRILSNSATNPDFVTIVSSLFN